MSTPVTRWRLPPTTAPGSPAGRSPRTAAAASPTFPTRLRRCRQLHLRRPGCGRRDLVGQRDIDSGRGSACAGRRQRLLRHRAGHASRRRRARPPRKRRRPDGDSVTVVTTPQSTPSNGSVLLAADGSFTYTPASGYSGTDSFTYTLDDGTGRELGRHRVGHRQLGARRALDVLLPDQRLVVRRLEHDVAASAGRAVARGSRRRRQARRDDQEQRRPRESHRERQVPDMDLRRTQRARPQRARRRSTSGARPGRSSRSRAGRSTPTSTTARPPVQAARRSQRTPRSPSRGTHR